MFHLLYKAGVPFTFAVDEDFISFSIIECRDFLSVTEGFLWVYDEALKYYQDLPKRLVRIDLPYLPPGINSNYGYGNEKVYKTKESKKWEEKSALIVGSTVNVAGWDYQEGKEYGIVIIWSGTKLDVDAPIKIIMDMITRKVGFDDKHIKLISSHKIGDDEEKLIAFLGEV